MALVVAACGGGGGGGGASAAPGQAQTVRVATVAASALLPLYVGDQEGIFKEHGINPKITLGTDFAAWQAAVGRQFDVVTSGTGLYMSSVARGLDNVILAGGNIATRDPAKDQAGILKLVTKEDIGEDLTQLRGKKVGVSDIASDPYAMLGYLLQRAGVDPHDVKWVTMPPATMLDNLKAGHIDAAVSVEPFASTMVGSGYFLYPHDLKVQANYLASNGEATTAPGALSVVNEGWLKKNPKLAQAFVDALNESIQWIGDHPEESRAYLAKWIGTPVEAQANAKLPEWRTEIKPEQIKANWQIWKSVGLIEGEYPADRVKIFSQD
jgi:NitT/TauT family transport system substrate-binding protein